MACPFVTEHGQIPICHFIIAHTKMNENPRLDSSSWLQCIFSPIFSFYHDSSYVCNKLKLQKWLIWWNCYNWFCRSIWSIRHLYSVQRVRIFCFAIVNILNMWLFCSFDGTRVFKIWMNLQKVKSLFFKLGTMWTSFKLLLIFVRIKIMLLHISILWNIWTLSWQFLQIFVVCLATYLTQQNPFHYFIF